MIEPRGLGASLVGGALALLLAACSTSGTPSPETEEASVDISAYGDVTAMVDMNSYTVTFPIDAYLMSPSDGDVIAQAYYLQFRSCLVGVGVDYALPTTKPSEGEPGFRRYGLWNVEEAAKYGYELPPTVVKDPGPFVSLSDEDFAIADRECISTVPRLPYVGAGVLPSDGTDASLYIAPEIEQTAYELAVKDERWADADDEFYACIETAGFVPDRGNMGPVVPEDPEGALRVAVVEATCSVETQRVQRLADIESQYQAALIDQKQTALNEVLEKEKQIVEEANAIVESLS